MEAMKYWDNEVCIQLQGATLVRGSFTINEFSITEGQDPDHNIFQGLTANFGSDGSMFFRIGRKGSSDNAKWFKERIMPSQTTFDSAPDKLNFAFLGTLQLVITVESMGNHELSCTFPGVALAQGRSGWDNNWWLGGKTFSHVPSTGPYAEARGSLPGGSEVVLGFANAALSSYRFYASPVSLIDTATWMQYLRDDTTLDRVMMPGSHDAGMSECSHCFPALLSSPWTQTQALSVGRQLEAGARYFDIRVDYDHNELVTYHRSGGNGCNGQNLKAVLDETVNFLKRNPSETAVLKVSHIRDFKGHDPVDTKRRINELLGWYEKSLVTKTANDASNLAQMPLEKLRGKMVLVFDYPDWIDPAVGRWRYQDGSAPSNAANLTVYDIYSDTDSYAKMHDDQLDKWTKYGGVGKGYLFLLSWTLTSNNPPFSDPIDSLAYGANLALPQVLANGIQQRKLAKPNVVYIDYVDQRVARSIILWNFS